MFLRQDAFTGTEKMLKGGLHFHTTRSDGKIEPGDAIRYCADHGYDFMALTDHRIYNFKNFAPDVPMTIIPGMEHDDTFVTEKGFRTWHVVCLGPEKEDGNGYEQDETLPEGPHKTQEEFQRFLDEAHSRGNLTILCHPEWSGTPTRYFDKLEGLTAIEVCNYGCKVTHGMDANNSSYWDELLGMGKRVYGVASDDSHRMWKYCHGWVSVNAENNVRSILDAIKRGAFYSSTGPVIRDFYLKDGKLTVRCSPAVKARFLSDAHPAILCKSWDTADEVFETEFNAEEYKYIRAEVTDAAGNMAWTNPIFFD